LPRSPDPAILFVEMASQTSTETSWSCKPDKLALRAITMLEFQPYNRTSHISYPDVRSVPSVEIVSDETCDVTITSVTSVMLSCNATSDAAPDAMSEDVNELICSLPPDVSEDMLYNLISQVENTVAGM